MKVRELIEKLQQLDQEKEISIFTDECYVYEPKIEVFEKDEYFDEVLNALGGQYIMRVG